MTLVAACGLFLLCLAVCGVPEHQERHLRKRDWSGVARKGDRLLLVENRTPGGYFEMELDGTPPREVRIKPTWKPWKGRRAFSDLESIDVLADGRIVMLSEDRAALVAKKGVLAKYPQSLAEIGNRGLEGIAVRPDEEGGSIVAVLHEGGFQLIGGSSDEPLPPRVFVHGVPKDEKRLGDVSGAIVELDVERPADGQRFRAPDLVWHRLPEDDRGKQPWGLIVLLGSTDRGSRTFTYSRLQRFSVDGRRVGKPFDLRTCAQVPEALRRASTNWEGMSWWEEGESLALCFDTHPRNYPPTVVVIDLPSEWR